MLIIMLVIIIVISFIILRMFIHAYNITRFFKITSNIYIWLDKKDAGLAAITAAKVAAEKQRNYLISEIQKQEHALISFPELEDNLKRVEYLKTTISEKDWMMEDIFISKEELRKLNPLYLTALENADISIFKERYPKLTSATTSATTILELLNASIEEARNDVLDKVDKIDRMTNRFPELKNNPDMQSARKELVDAITKSKNT